MYGPDVASTRTDDLDRLMLAAIAQKDHPTVLDLGCGAGGQSLRLADVGATVLAIDIADYRSDFAALQSEIGTLTFRQVDIRELEAVLGGRQFTDCCLQRTLHYLSYQAATTLLQQLRSTVTDRLYISVTGIETAIADGYMAASLSIEQRFAALDPGTADMFSIHEPVCLYTEEEFTNILRITGWQVEQCWASAFGNLKAICR